MTLQETIEQIHPLSKEAMDRAKAHWDGIAKPLHSLGKLEDVLIQIAGITGKEEISIEKRALLTFCADNGVVEENVTQSGQEVTATVAENFLQEKATAAILCRSAHADLFPIDIGMARDTKVPRYKVAYGTKNMAKGPAMTREQAADAILYGMQLVKDLKEEGYRLIATGEMGIGNTTTSSAVASVLLQKDPELVTGAGAGLDSAGLKRKTEVIRRGIGLHHPDPMDGMEVLQKVGGFDLAAMAGAFLGGAIYHVPVVIDGVIAAAAAAAAGRIAPAATDYMLAAHVSAEPASIWLLDLIGVTPAIQAGLRLGEGTGALALFPLLDMALSIYRDMDTFAEMEIEEYKPLV